MTLINRDRLEKVCRDDKFCKVIYKVIQAIHKSQGKLDLHRYKRADNGKIKLKDGPHKTCLNVNSVLELFPQGRCVAFSAKTICKVDVFFMKQIF